MSKIEYQSFNFRQSTLEIIDRVNKIITNYLAQGYDLTLRQLYYQLISRYYDELPESWIDPKTGSKNNEKSYDKLGNIVNDGRLAGLIDWSAIVDRTRNVQSLSHWSNPASIIDACVYSYRLDKWDNQEYRPEVWIEKDALRGVITGICQQLDIPHFSCRGYSSQSEMWATGQRMIRHIGNGQVPYIIHLGDHDPSGLDMTQDIIKRLEMFTGEYEGEGFFIKRIALNFDQVEQYQPPNNPAKLTDSRATAYIDQYGESCWELDALDPNTISELIRDEVFGIRDVDKLAEMEERQEVEKDELKLIKANYRDVIRYLRNGIH